MSELDDFDYSWARPDPAQMHAAGIQVVCRYLWQGGKGISAAELSALLAAGIGVMLNYEADSGDHLLGAAKGVINGAHARSLMDALPGTAGLPIYFSCDQQVIGTAAHATTMAYLHAADSAAHQSRCYAQKSVCDDFGRPAWQTIAWSDGEVSSRAVIYQYLINQTFHGSAVDYNDILDASQLGALWPAGHQPQGTGTAIKPTGTPNTGDDDMQATELVPVPGGGQISYASAIGAIEGYTQATNQQAQQTNTLLGQLINAVTVLTAAVKAAK